MRSIIVGETKIDGCGWASLSQLYFSDFLKPTLFKSYNPYLSFGSLIADVCWISLKR